MKSSFAVLFVLVLSMPTSQADTASNAVNPIQKVLQMLSGLQSKIIREGAQAQKVYEEFAEWCDDRCKETRFEIKTAKAEMEQLDAVIEEESATADSLDAKIEALAAAISTDEGDLKAAAFIRAHEFEVYSAQEAELSDSISALERAVGILEREAKGGASLLQSKSSTDLTQIFSVMVEAASLSVDDASKLTALVQSSTSASDDDDSDLGAPDAAAYENHSGGVIETLQGILSKAQSTLQEARKTETQEKNNYEVFKLALDDKVKAATKEVDAAKQGKAAAEEAKATAQGDLAVTSKDLASTVKALEGLHHDCMSRANDFEEETTSRGQELKALAAAKKIIGETTRGSGGAEEQTYGAVASFVQVSLKRTAMRADLSDFKLVRFVRHLASKLHSPMLAQLSQRLSTVVESSTSSGDDPFVKVKGLITDMVERLQREAEAEASKKEYCDKEMAETEANKEDKEDDVDKLSTRIDKMVAESKKLKEETAVLQRELGALAKSLAEADKLRQEEHAAFVNNKAEMEEGLEGIKAALKVLRDYYAADDKNHEAAEGASSGIIGLLEVTESDFSSGLSGMVQEEEDAQAEWQQNANQGEVTQKEKEQDLKYKTKEAKSLDKAVAEASSDRDGVQTTLDAINEYYAKVKEECIAKPEPYAERKARRETEIAGLKEALDILEGQAVFLQTSSSTASLRR